MDYEVVDVFTYTAFSGNPLAVVLGADELDTAALQKIANEFALPETAFPMVSGVDEGDYRVRIFTPGRELPFAGHPSIGAAWVLARRGLISPGPIVQSCGAGLLNLDVTAFGGPVTLTGGAPSCGPPREAAGLLTAVGLTTKDLAGVVRDASCGLGFTFLPVVPEALERLEVNAAALSRLGLGPCPELLGEGPFGGVSVVAWDGVAARCRVFSMEAAITEDPATGAAALALGVYLVASGLIPGEGETAYDVVSGVEMGRPSLLSCLVVASGGTAVSCRVSGAVVPVAAGRIRRP